ncbi:efflux RND transporter permease subunit [Pseudodesulfovibrio senegalensis]|uniref:Efflux RND transporter permease subunit n=1 Tax=Pseudodesulfovibrio senegalensis TaxID=1721087 RepID=A0A6N6MZ92_9BACT|nr:efflux RND transporter permease subunit [Pseudodesulfovibrio senegalensis]KAB1440867.1 efflux RND transporter permease subunit [Pseudodesulfovibrio senegalensis]
MEPGKQHLGPVRGLVDLTLRQKVFVNLVFVLLMVVGVFCAFDLPVERYPDVRMGKVIISAYLPGASATEVEALVTREIEDALDDLENVEFVRSRSYRERSSIMVKFLDDTDYDRLYDELRFKVLTVQNDLPSTMDPPQFMVVRISEWLPVVSVNLVGDRSNRALTLMAEEIKVPLERIPGVKEVQIDGEYAREFHVHLDPDKLMRFGVTFDEVARALEQSNVTIPAGDFVSRTGEYVILVDEKFRTREQVAATVVRRDLDGSLVTVGDVIDHAGLGYRDPFVIASVNGQDCVSVDILKTPQGNSLEIESSVRRIVADYESTMEKEGVAAVLTQNQRNYIDDNISTLGSNLLVGIFLVCVCIWVVMGFRNAMLTTVGVPFSFLVTMVIMWLTGNSLNEITLFSFVLVSGIIVDDAIVVVENVYRHIQQGKDLRVAVIHGTGEVFLPVIAATSTTVAAFLPMLIMSGSTGEFFALVPKAVSFAIIASLLECLFILPSHILDWPGASRLSKEAVSHGLRPDPDFLLRLRARVDKTLVFVMRHQWKSLGVIAVAFVMAMIILGVSVSGVMPLIRIKFFPDDYTTYYVSLRGPVGTPVEDSSRKVKAISRDIESLGKGMAVSCSGLAGMDINTDYESIYGSNLGIVIVELPDKDNQAFVDNPDNDPLKMLEWVRGHLAPFAEGGWKIRVWPQKDGPPTGKDVNIRILGSDHGAVAALKNDLHSWLTANTAIAPYLIDLHADTGTDNRVFRFLPDPVRIAEFGLAKDQVAALAGSVLDGRFVGEFRVADEDIDLKLMIDPNRLETPEDALNIPVLEHQSGPVRLGDLCGVRSYREPGQRNRYQGQRAVTLTADIRPGSPVTTTSIVHDVRAYYNTVKDKYPGAAVDFSGEYESTGRSFASLASAFVIALMIMYTILACQFQSYTQPLVIMSVVIFALTGVVWGTFLTRSLFTINSFIATVGVTGVVVNDSLVLLDFINKLYRGGMSLSEAAREGVRIRLRPILLTTLTTTLGLLPMAIGIPYYSLVWGTMATTFVTGLCVATALTLFIIPVEWSLLMRFEQWKRGRKNRRAGSAEQE